MPETIARPRVDLKREIRFFSREAVKAFIRKESDGTDGYYLEAPCSSTVKDRMGDVISVAAEQKMEQQVKAMTIWLNHEYTVPEDIFGTCEKSELVAADDPTQGPCFDLIIRVRCHVENPRVMATWNAVNKKVQLGFSIGGYIPDDGYEFKETPDGDYIFIINDIELLEVSVVGIPANQRAIIDDVAKDLAASVLLFDDLTVLGDKKVASVSERVSPRRREKIAQQRAAMPAQAAALARGVSFKEGEPEAVVPGAAEAPAGSEAAPATETPPDGDKPPTEAETPAKAAPQVIDLGAISPDEVAEVERALTDPKRSVLITAGGGRAIVTIKDADGDDDGDKPGVLDPAVQKKIAKAIGHIHDSMQHGLCTDSMAHVGKAHKCLMSLMPDAPDDDASDTEAGDIEASVAVATQMQIDKLLSEIDDQQKALSASKAEADALVVEIEQKRTEVAALDALIAERKATPLGRVTRGHVRSGSPGGEDSTDPERRLRSEGDMLSDLASKLAGKPVDARTRGTS